ncbi:hypothetical protein N7X57_06580 [Lactiplantibacillus paraplantarum]|uniref:LiaF transmembrane domain-containing protein n=1 Tax=Lactiplantibacillus paraplantarum TaxID=60520 RepID=UPI0005131417|nr:membrane protein [Lactiplantibacillus paraplantarum]OAX74455.1 hypothetical protein A0U96_00640 [Lactiplantibacillus plantarum]ALO04015.1 hypothetical protein ASU28_06465 [Lactiplantibacillus paraplantarum]KGE74406.1 membrane protein [Lactiplantibacillus paraplantarum]MCT4458078.1 hypothetical protein [Lactiplantibacillus paraplantarum]MCW1910109.1 hypothetical protein [Lactiplantibacillus paraplantarum]
MRKNWFWPVFLIASAVILVVSQLGLFTFRVSAWSLFLTLILIAALISSLRYLNMPGVVFALAFLAIIYAQPLGITKLVPWTILGAALLLSIGLGLLIRPRYRYHHHDHYHHHNHGDDNTSTGTISDDHVNLDLSLGNSIRYVHSDHFSSANLNVSMAGAKIYFDDVNIQENQAMINVDVSLGSLELYLPKAWQVQDSLSNSMGHISFEGSPTTVGPRITLSGSVSLGELRIIYI